MQAILSTIIGGEKIFVEVESTNPTPLQIKQCVQEKTGIDIADQTVIYAGKIWENNKTLVDFAGSCDYEISIKYLSLLYLKLSFKGEMLCSVADKKFQELKARYLDLACDISVYTREYRYTLDNTPDTETFWNNLNKRERMQLLRQPNFNAEINKFLETEKQRREISDARKDNNTKPN